MFACSICGIMAAEMQAIEDHIVRDHVDAALHAAVEDALRECYQIYELERLWKLRVM